MINRPNSSQTGPDEAAELKIEDLAELVSGMSRFLLTLVRTKAFREAGIELTEWAALSVLAKDGSLTDRRLGHAIGLPGRLAKTLVERLVRADLVTLEQNDDGGPRTARLSDKGTAVLMATNAVLREQFAQPMTENRRAFAVANRLVNRRLILGLRSATSRTAGSGGNGRVGKPRGQQGTRAAG